MRWASVNWAMELSKVVLFLAVLSLASFVVAMVQFPNPSPSIDPTINAQRSLRDILNLTWFIIALLISIALALLGLYNEVKRLREQMEASGNN
jgi:ABC-type Co2+ transport system permease subunit